MQRARIRKYVFMTLRLYVRWLLILSMAGGCLSALAVTLTAQTRQLNPLSSVSVLEDPAGELTLAQVRTLDGQFTPWAGPGDRLNFGFTPSVYWLKLPLQREAQAPAEWWLSIDYAKLHELDLYQPDGTAVLTGTDRGFASRQVFDPFFVFRLQLTPEVQHYYIRVASRYALTVPMTIWQPNAYRATQQRFDALQFLYYGVLVVLAIYGLVFFLAMGDRRFAIYSAYIVTAGIGIFASNGYGRLFFWQDQELFDDIAQSIFLSLAALFAVWFARRLIGLDPRSMLERAMVVTQALFALSVALTLGHVFYPHLLMLANQLLLVTAVVMGWLVTVAGFKAYRRRQSGIRFFLLGWVVLWLGACIATGRAFGWIPTTGLTSYILQITTTIEMLLVALALGELLHEEHQAHVHSQAQALAANKALLELSQASEEKLRLAVAERTAQLEISLQEEKNLREQYVRIGSMISHEFRTPLGIIQSQAMLMRKEYTKGIDQVIKRLEAIAGASQRLKSMFDKWLYSDSLHETLAAMVVKPLDLQLWVVEQVQEQRVLLTNHTLVLRPGASVRPVMADEYHLELVLGNLIENAAKYAPGQTTITLSLHHKEGFSGLAVTDQGPGIPLDVQDKIFRAFFRVSPESQVRGVGLGLSIVQRIVQAHGGHIELTSTPGQGATFCVWLPCSA